MRTRWLDRRIAAPGPYLALCLSEAEFRAAMKHLAPSGEVPRWIKTPTANATTHYLTNRDNKSCCLICLGDGWQGRNPVEVAGLLVHEAVHVWQGYCEHIGEHTPGTEQEAYGIQAIAQELFAEFARRTQPRQAATSRAKNDAASWTATSCKPRGEERNGHPMATRRRTVRR